jgi:hypothetical protein|nr:MAG TPA: Protein of unknown function (DUF2514) [Caudoviricetes sp.]
MNKLGWQVALAVLGVAILMTACHVQKQRGYAKGYAAAQAKFEAMALSAENARVQAVRQTEQKTAASYAAKLQTIEQEKQDAQIAVRHLRDELSRVQRRVATTTNQGASAANLPQTARASADAHAAQGWQLFGKCSERYAGLAEIADRQRDDLAAWQAYGAAVDGMSGQ